LSLWTNRNLVHQSKWEFSITPVDGGMCCPGSWQSTNRHKQKKWKGRKNTGPKQQVFILFL
jgi:hypothetical protein